MFRCSIDGPSTLSQSRISGEGDLISNLDTVDPRQMIQAFDSQTICNEKSTVEIDFSIIQSENNKGETWIFSSYLDEIRTLLGKTHINKSPSCSTICTNFSSVKVKFSTRYTKRCKYLFLRMEIPMNCLQLLKRMKRYSRDMMMK